MQLYDDLKGKGTYASVKNVEARMVEVCEQFGIDFRYIVGTNSGGRFFPVVVLRSEEQWLAGSLAFVHVCVTF